MKKIVLAVLMFLSMNAVAGPGTGTFQLKEVRMEKGVAYLFPKTSISNGLQCSQAAPIVLIPDDLGFSEMYSMSLSALMSGKNIKCWLRSCVSSPWGDTRPKAYACGLESE